MSDTKNLKDPEVDATKRPLGRRDFVRLVGGGVAVTAGVLVADEPAVANPPDETFAGGEKVIGPGPVAITLRVNGQAKKLTVQPRVTLLDALRDTLDITGAKKVCDRGTCGACTMIVNGRPVYSCTIFAIDVADRGMHPGADIQTIEGLAPEGQLHPLSAAFVENDAQQCGFCTPGFVMACKAYLDKNPHPTVDQVKHALGGNLCRCGTYVGVRAAAVAAGTKMKGGQS
jgi:xanthine dehydrogenase YagT iron-sulfur-binding subunit